MSDPTSQQMKVFFNCVEEKKITDKNFQVFLNNFSSQSSSLRSSGAISTNNNQNTFVTPLDDRKVPKKYRKTVAKWRSIAATLGYTGPVAWDVKAGFALKTHAPLAGPCYKNLDYMKDWNLQNDEPTKDSLVFWIPRLVSNSTSKTVKQMEELRAEFRKLHKLPKHHCTNFGSISLLFVLILAYFKLTNERVPLNYFYAASDVLRAGGVRLVAGCFYESGLYCNDWDEGASYDVGFFPLGVELGH